MVSGATSRNSYTDGRATKPLIRQDEADCLHLAATRCYLDPRGLPQSGGLGVVGSNPAAPTNFSKDLGAVLLPRECAGVASGYQSNVFALLPGVMPVSLCTGEF